MQQHDTQHSGTASAAPAQEPHHAADTVSDPAHTDGDSQGWSDEGGATETGPAVPFER